MNEIQYEGYIYTKNLSYVLLEHYDTVTYGTKILKNQVLS